MARPRTVSHTVVVAATAESLYEMVSDPTRMGGWSPENTGATLAGPDTGRAAVGTVFDGHNRRGRMRWTTRCVVTAADPGERFAFSVRAWGLRTPLLRAPIASWEYRFEAVPGGTRVTETWTDDRAWPDAVANWPPAARRSRCSTCATSRSPCSASPGRPRRRAPVLSTAGYSSCASS